MIKYYFDELQLDLREQSYDTQILVVNNDTFTTASEYIRPCCLNFASHKRPGGGYLSVIDLPGPIRTQEEDLFRRSNLPELMDNSDVRFHYPLTGLKSIYCSDVHVTKDRYLKFINPFEVAVISVPAVVNPSFQDLQLISNRIRHILAIAQDQHHENLILGAWGCGVFRNDPYFIASTFRKHLLGEFAHIFQNVIFAIPGGNNYKIFQEALIID
jgi:uncharacterized protein (TIGR02452 family)